MLRWPTAILAVAVVAALVVTGALVVSIAASAPALTRPVAHADASLTLTTTFEPWHGDRLDPSLRVVAKVTGRCFTSSLAVEARSAWRCEAGDTILDPCFAPPSGPGSTLACATPWSGVTLLRLDASLPNAAAGGAKPSDDWLLRLANGATCSLSEGAAGVRDGRAIAYSCSGGAAAGALHSSSEPWRVAFLPARGPVREVAVTRAWG